MRVLILSVIFILFCSIGCDKDGKIDYYIQNNCEKEILTTGLLLIDGNYKTEFVYQILPGHTIKLNEINVDPPSQYYIENDTSDTIACIYQIDVFNLKYESKKSNKDFRLKSEWTLDNSYEWRGRYTLYIDSTDF